ncbi:pyrimidine/purine nucleoside phosphorylase [Effusibacillus consociatus]|uniref:Pyrimidine/purine nucleoside phosphorylase n=1 Tax=Effusibacillus consociatus TaxID=1117041 RepID=A0ABV9PX61_9BACL
MSEFKNVTVVKNANVYFEGKVTSRTVLFADGSKKTLGVMLPGEYEFGTSVAEEMEVLAGKVEILLPGESEWKLFDGEGSFFVPANAKFKLKVHSVFDYCCSYLAG